jgi:hypothetical protein
MAGQAHLHSLRVEAHAVKDILFRGTTLTLTQGDSGARLRFKNTKSPHPPSGTTITSVAPAGPGLPPAISLSSRHFRSVSALIMMTYLSSALV